MKQIKLTLGLFAASMAALWTPALAQEPIAGSKLEQMAEAAQSPAEHVAVAKEFRLRAENFEAKAKKHEETAQKLQAQPKSAIAHKWPAMSRQPWVKERQLAIEAQRAAKESFDLADRHMRLGVEALADASERPASTTRARTR